MNTDRTFLLSAVLAAMASVATAVVSSTTGQDYDWERAEREIVRLPPSAFKELPADITKKLKDEGCTIPQADFYSDELHNVIQGEFARKGQKDWAVLCSREGKSSILVVWGGPGDCPDRIADAEDKHFLQGGGEGRVHYSRVILPVGEGYIVEHYEWYGGPKPPPIDHQGINDAFAGKASVVRYCYQGKWLQLTGAD